MGIIQVNKIVNSIVGQALGREELIGTDTSFVSLGDEVLSTAENTSAVYNVLAQRIGATVNSIRAYRSRDAILRRTPMEWGSTMQKLSFPLISANENPSWLGVEDEGDANVLGVQNKTKPTQKLFNKISTWEFDMTIWNYQLKQAFTSPETMYAFIDMIFTSAYNSQECAYENMDNLCRASLIGNIIGTDRAINLREMYNTETGKSISVAQCLYDADFLIYASMIISIFSSRMRKMSRTFNDGTMDRHTPKDLQVLTVLTDFAKRFDFAAKSGAYHDNLVDLPMYTETPYWQGSGKTWDFDDVSAIDVLIGEDGTQAVQQTGIIALLTDFETIGTIAQNEQTNSIYNPKRKFTNYFMTSDIGYFNDISENAVVFYIA